MIKVLLVDDHEVVRVAIKTLLAEFQSIVVVGEAHDPESAISLCRSEQPDVVLMDYHLGSDGSYSGIKLLKRLLIIDDALKVIMLTSYHSPVLAKKCLMNGGKGFLLKGSPIGNIKDSIEEVNKGGIFLDGEIANSLALPDGMDDQKRDFFSLTLTEFEIAKLICSGVDKEAICDCLSISRKTLQNHHSIILNKMNVSNDIELLYAMNRLKLVDLDVEIKRNFRR